MGATQLEAGTCDGILYDVYCMSGSRSRRVYERACPSYDDAVHDVTHMRKHIKTWVFHGMDMASKLILQPNE